MRTDDLSPRSRLMYGATGLAVIAVVALLLSYGMFPSYSGSTYYTATFARAGQGLDHESDVKIRGIAVGGVESVKLDPDGRARVRFRVDHGIRLPTSTVVSVEPTSVFGPKDLTLDLGSEEGSGPYFADNATIRQTRDPQELSDTAWPLYRLTGAINPEELSGLVHTFAQGLQGEGPALHRTLGNLTTLTDLAYGKRAAIKQALTDLTQLAGTFGGRGDELTRLTADINAVAPAIADRPEQFGAMLDQLNRLSAGLTSSLNDFGDRIGPLVDATSNTVSVLYRQQDKILPLINGLITLFGSLNDIIRVPGPSGTLLAQAVNYTPLDLCQILVDVCGKYAGKGGR